MIRRIGFLVGVAWAFIRRSLATYASYKAKISLGLASLLLSVVTFSFVGRVVSESGPGFVERYGMNYASFVVVGVLVHSVASAGLNSFRSSVRREQLRGTLELLVTTRVPVPVLVTLSGLGELVVVAVGAAVFLGLATVLLGLRLAVSPTIAAAVILYALFMCGVGLASAGMIFVSKEGEPVSWALSAATGLMGGVYFPVDVLPPWLAKVALALPTTHALALTRAGLGTSVGGGPARSLVFLAVSAAISLSLGFLVVNWGYRRARRSGTLGEY